MRERTSIKSIKFATLTAALVLANACGQAPQSVSTAGAADGNAADAAAVVDSKLPYIRSGGDCTAEESRRIDERMRAELPPRGDPALIPPPEAARAPEPGDRFGHWVCDGTVVYYDAMALPPRLTTEPAPWIEPVYASATSEDPIGVIDMRR